MRVSIDHSVRNNGCDADRHTFPQTNCLTKLGIAYVPMMTGVYVLLCGSSLSRYLHVLHLLLVGGRGRELHMMNKN